MAGQDKLWKTNSANGLEVRKSQWFLGIEILTYFTACGLGLVVSSAMGTVEAASALGPPLMIVFLLFGGPVYSNRSAFQSLLRFLA